MRAIAKGNPYVHEVTGPHRDGALFHALCGAKPLFGIGWWYVISEDERRRFDQEDCDECKDVEKPETDDDA